MYVKAPHSFFYNWQRGQRKNKVWFANGKEQNKKHQNMIKLKIAFKGESNEHYKLDKNRAIIKCLPADTLGLPNASITNDQ